MTGSKKKKEEKKKEGDRKLKKKIKRDDFWRLVSVHHSIEFEMKHSICERSQDVQL